MCPQAAPLPLDLWFLIWKLGTRWSKVPPKLTTLRREEVESLVLPSSNSTFPESQVTLVLTETAGWQQLEVEEAGALRSPSQGFALCKRDEFQMVPLLT